MKILDIWECAFFCLVVGGSLNNLSRDQIGEVAVYKCASASLDEYPLHADEPRCELAPTCLQNMIPKVTAHATPPNIH